MYKPGNFIPADLIINNWSDLKPYFDKLEKQNIETTEALEKMILHLSDILSIFAEQSARAYINMTCHTDNPDFVKTHETFATIISPEVEIASNTIQKKLAASPCFANLPAGRYSQLQKSIKRDLELFRKENVPLEAALSKLASQYGQLAGSLTVDLDGKTLTIPEASVFLESSDRERRKQAWLAIVESRFNKKTEHSEIFNQMVKLRHNIALNAGYKNFRDYQHDNLHRFDYTVNDVLKFHESIEKCILPLKIKIAKKHRNKLKLDKADYRPWDETGKPLGQPPLKPFVSAQELLDKTNKIFSKIRPEFGENIKTMEQNNLFDLDTRKAKAPGGYNYGLEVTGMPFIFMNAAGVHRDVITLMHEGGHAMHTFLTHDEPLIQYRHCPSEVAETASMSMELISSTHWDIFYNKQELVHARREHLEDIIGVFAWVATVDCFQHWIYTHPEHTPAERDEAFLKIINRFSTGLVNWEGYEPYRKNLWQRQLHIFEAPFYYIEYAIAQLGALQVYRNYIKEPDAAIQAYIRGLSLGHTKPIAEVWGAMNISFDFSEKTIKDLMDFAQEEIARLDN
ncbi:MAG: M3 family oligoendopeptidase [Deltaproteobacteria bacterium]|nr:M3 family oligoendopeptidase [Deltaproteobacteria bacterium]